MKSLRKTPFGILCCYILFVMVRIVAVRETQENYRYKLQPFWSYGVEGGLWENMLKVLLFIPIGFLLRQSFIRMPWWMVVVVGFLFSVVIELMQLFLKKGFCEIDDVFHNTVGGIFGLILCWLKNKRV